MKKTGMAIWQNGDEGKNSCSCYGNKIKGNIKSGNAH